MILRPDYRALLLRELRTSLREILQPELGSAHAVDSAAAMDRILTMMIVEDERGSAIGDEAVASYSAALTALSASLPAGASAREGIANALESLDACDQSEALAALRAAGQIALGELGRDGLSDPGTRAKIAALVDSERDFLEAVTKARDEVTDRGEAADTNRVSSETVSITADQLTQYLRERLPDEPDLRVTRLTLIPGGRSKETIAIDIDRGGRLPPTAILRKDRPVSIVDSRASDEYPLLEVVHAAGVPVPEPFLCEADPERLGGSFILLERVAGSKQGEYFPEIMSPKAHGREIGLQLARGFARLHAIPLSALSKTKLDLEPEPRRILEASIEGIYQRLLTAEGPPSIGVELAHSWLLDNIDIAITDPCLCHTDTGLHNYVIDGARLTALVDWELAAIASPASDIARARMAIGHMMDWDEFVAAYLDAGGGGEACDPARLDFYEILAQAGGSVTSRLGGSLFLGGQKRDLLTANSGYDSHHRTSRLLAVALSRALAR